MVALVGVLSALHLLSGELIAQVTGNGTGLQATGVVCRNLGTGATVIDTTGVTDWDCAALGLVFSPGDRIETGLRGTVVPVEQPLGLDVRSGTLPADFLEELAGDNSFRLHAADFDDDGDFDILSSSPLKWFENLGGASPTFVVHDLTHLIGVSDGVNNAEVVDATGDGRPDFVAGNKISASWDRYSLFVNNGGSPPTFSRIDIASEFGWDSRWGASGDIDGDGDMDFYLQRVEVLGCGFSCTSATVWMENVGSDTFVEHAVEDPGFVDHLAAIDFDGDGDPDLVGTSGATFHWFENDNTTFTELSIPMSATPQILLVPVDLDSDGDLDIATRTSDEEAIWLENIDGGVDWVEHVIHTFPSFSFNGFSVADLTGDGRPDLAFGQFEEPVWLENLGGSPLTFRQHTLPFVDTDIRVGPGAADIDLDGRIDLLGETADSTLWYRNQIGRRLTVSGMSVRGFFCRNRTTGQTVRVPTTDSATDCENEGLTVNPGDEIEVFARGQAE